MGALKSTQRELVIERIGDLCESYCRVCSIKSQFKDTADLTIHCNTKCEVGKELLQCGSRLLGTTIQPPTKQHKRTPNLTKEDYLICKQKGMSNLKIMRMYKTSHRTIKKFEKGLA